MCVCVCGDLCDIHSVSSGRREASASPWQLSLGGKVRLGGVISHEAQHDDSKQ